MSLQITWVRAFVVTLGAAEWFVSGMGSFMGLQMLRLPEFFTTL